MSRAFAYQDDPAYPMGTKEAWVTPVNDNPGPGAYTVVQPPPTVESVILERRERRQQGISRAKRSTAEEFFDRQKAETPGPGSYYIPDGFQSARSRSISTFGHRPPLFRKATDGPGPGSYRGAELKSKVKGSAWGSFSSKRFPDFSNEDQPGPGMYSPRSGTVGQASRSAGFGTHPRQAIREGVKDLSWTPGPGAYEPRTPREGPHITLKLKLPQSHESDSPGPGAYHPPPVGIKPSAPAYSLTQRPRSAILAPPDVPTEFAYSAGRHPRGQSAGIGRHEFGRPKTARAY